MSDIRPTSDTDGAAARQPRHAPAHVDVTLCGQCHTCQGYFPCRQLYVLQIRSDDTYQDTGRLICSDCHRQMMSPRSYQVRDLSREEVTGALRRWLAHRHLLMEDAPGGTTEQI